MKEKFIVPFFTFFITFGLVIFAILFADLFYQPKELKKRGYQIELSADGKPIVKKEVQVDIATLMKSANVENGAKIFKKCATCHNIERGAGNKVGPNLFGVSGRAKASVSGFSYSQAMSAKGGSWSRDDLNNFLTKPKDFIAGTKMGFAGLKKPQDRADVILFLESKK